MSPPKPWAVNDGTTEASDEIRSGLPADCRASELTSWIGAGHDDFLGYRIGSVAAGVANGAPRTREVAGVQRRGTGQQDGGDGGTHQGRGLGGRLEDPGHIVIHELPSLGLIEVMGQVACGLHATCRYKSLQCNIQTNCRREASIARISRLEH